MSKNSYSFDNVFKLYKRFLKENGIYKRVFEIHKKSYGRKHTNSLRKALDATEYDRWLQDCDLFCLWRGSYEGEYFWWLKHIKWVICLRETYGEKVSYDEIGSFMNLKKEFVCSSSKSEFLEQMKEHSEFLEQMKEDMEFIEKYIEKTNLSHE